METRTSTNASWALVKKPRTFMSAIASSATSVLAARDTSPSNRSKLRLDKYILAHFSKQIGYQVPHLIVADCGKASSRAAHGMGYREGLSTSISGWNNLT
eukprot:scpid104838/ scgid18920/ 